MNDTEVKGCQGGSVIGQGKLSSESVGVSLRGLDKRKDGPSWKRQRPEGSEVNKDRLAG